MQLNNTSQYAIRILSYMANTDDSRSLNAKELSEILAIPYKFLTKIMTELVKADFVISMRGREGGYKLSKPASSITVMNILNQFNEFLDDDQCILGVGTCDGEHKCSLHNQWVEPKALMRKMFEETTLEKLDGKEFKL
ncbi:MAG: Rrf2 family transcriptional regulator [Campylobacterota bacterium]